MEDREISDSKENEVSGKSGSSTSIMDTDEEPKWIISPLSQYNPDVASRLRQFSSGRECQMKHAQRYLEFGKRQLELGKLERAVSHLSYACWQYSKLYGPIARECGEVCMTYGQVLLQRWTKWHQAVKKGCETIETVATDEETKENLMEMKDENVGWSSHSQDKEGCLSLALRILDRAKVIFGNAGDYVNLAKVLSSIAEVRVHESNFTAAAEDFNTALMVLKRTSGSGILQASIHLKLCSLYSGDASSGNAEEEIMKAYVSVGASLRSLNERSLRYQRLKKKAKSKELNEEIARAQKFVERLTKRATELPLEHERAIEVLKHDMEEEILVYSDCQEDEEAVADILSALSVSNKDTSPTSEEVRPELFQMPDMMGSVTELAATVDKYISDLVQTFITKEQEQEELHIRQTKKTTVTETMEDGRIYKRRVDDGKQVCKPDESSVKKRCSEPISPCMTSQMNYL